MNQAAKIQKWGNSAAIRLPSTVLAAAGITVNSEVDIQAEQGRLVIQLPEQTKEKLFDQLLSEIPDIEKVLAEVQGKLTHAITATEITATHAEQLCDCLLYTSPSPRDA